MSFGVLSCLLRYLIVNHVLYLAVAYVSVGTLGTGFMSRDNKYSYKGKSISHADVLKMIADAKVA